MGDIGAIVLHLILQDKNLEAWSRVKLAYLDPSYSSLYTAINKFYSTYDKIPGFDDLELTVSRDGSLARALSALKSLEVPEVDLEVAIDTLVNTYAQNEALKLVEKFIDRISLMDTEEIKDSLAEVSMKLDEKTHTSEKVVTMNTICIFKEPNSIDQLRTPSGINNTFDANMGGFYREELILVGGKRGAGKSIVGANIVVNQYEAGNCPVFFTIEMTAQETFERMIAMLARVPYAKIRQDILNDDESNKVAKVRAEMFTDGLSHYNDFLKHRDRMKFEKALNTYAELKPDNQIIIIDDRQLSLPAIDLHLQKLRARFGDKLTISVIDYLNQIVVPGSENSMYDWTTQIYVSKKLKEFARKNNTTVISPYQIDDNGETRFAKGILDAADIAFLLDAHAKVDQVLSLKSTKLRSASEVIFHSGMDWDTLRINPVDAIVPEKKDNKKSKKDEEVTVKVNDALRPDIPW